MHLKPEMASKSWSKKKKQVGWLIFKCSQMRKKKEKKKKNFQDLMSLINTLILYD